MREYIWLTWTDWHKMCIRWHLQPYTPGLEPMKRDILCKSGNIPSGEIINSRVWETHPSIKLVCKKCQQLADGAKK